MNHKKIGAGTVNTLCLNETAARTAARLKAWRIASWLLVERNAKHTQPTIDNTQLPTDN
jgi:hypothetical protein